ncbi:MAG TPA: hypothetical protein VEU53_02310 [Stellaceae bacterium]|nr:hypothetical protein [Stellaceae bacterium]
MMFLARLLRDESGKASLSYAVMAIIVAVVAFAAACSIDANLRPH